MRVGGLCLWVSGRMERGRERRWMRMGMGYMRESGGMGRGMGWEKC